MADRTLAYLRKAFNWYAARDDQFNVTALRAGMASEPKGTCPHARLVRRRNPHHLARLGEAGTFGALVKMLLLTAQRRDEVAQMSRKEIGEDGIWEIPAERYKTKRPNFIPLSKAALAVIDAQPKIDDCDLIFPSRAKTPFSGFGKSKATLDKAVLAAMKKHAKKGSEGRSLAKLDPS